MKPGICFILINILFITNIVLAQSSSDRLAVKRAVLDYVEAAYEVDTNKTIKRVHPHLAKVGYYYDGEKYKESPMTFRQMIEVVRNYNKDEHIPKDAIKEVTIFDVLDKTAAAKVTAVWGVDYIHLTKLNGKWMITQILWQSLPEK